MKLNIIYPYLSLVIIFLSCNSKEKISEEKSSKPNIVLIMADDMGFSDIGSYGGEVQTPNLDKLANEGIRYTQFYNNARCCPTRASLMTGVYPHQAGMGWMTAADLGTPAYQGELNDKSVTIAEVLKGANYSTYMSGKWHLSRVRNIRAGVKDNWPVQRGFDRFFGIVDGASNYFTPTVFSDNRKYKALKDDFYFTHAVSDSAAMFIDKHFSEKKDNPMFMYVAYTAPHWPLHALQKDIDKYRDMYMMGWDKLRSQRLAKQKELGIFEPEVELSPRDSHVPAWEELSREEQKEFAKRMAIYAAQIDAMDQGIGRIISKLKETGQYNNTLIFFLSDNGACAEFISGGPSKEITGKGNTFESYRINWANVGSTPYREYKHWIHEGGIATPLLVHWPNGVSKELKGNVVREPGHIMDVMATVVDITGADYPSQYRGNKIQPMQGNSLLPHFKGIDNNREPIFWEHEGNIGVRDGKWKLVAKTEEDHEFNQETLELYNMVEDPSELNNLARKYPERLEQMFAAWKTWSEKVNVIIDTREYGKRAQAYQRKIEGEFENNFAGWKLVGENIADFKIDTTTQISGKNSALLTLRESGNVGMQWPFFAKKGENFRISFSAKSSSNLKIQVVFESEMKNKKTVLLKETVKVNETTNKYCFRTSEVPNSERFRISLYPIGLEEETVTRFWVDSVQLEPLESHRSK